MQLKFSSNYNKFVRRKSFISLDIENMATLDFKKNKIDNAILIINKQETTLKNIYIMYYNLCKWFLSYIYIKEIYSKTYDINKIIFCDNKKFFITRNKVYLKLCDHGIYFENCYVPYEYIISFRKCNKSVYIELFASIELIDNEIKINLSNNKIYLLMNVQDKDCLNIIEEIKKNMYYHIKHNKIDDKVLDYYEEEKSKTNTVTDIIKEEKEELSEDEIIEKKVDKLIKEVVEEAFK
jgi:hypothetical protein